MSARSLAALAPHYLAMLLLAALAVGAVRIVAGRAVLVAEFAAMLLVVAAYPFAARRLGIAPERWG